MRPPRLIKPYVESFSRQVLGMSGNVDLTYLPCTPINHSSDRDCFYWVDEFAKSNGGSTVFGWAIWEFPKVFIEAEFHAVWRSSEGTLKDITPRTKPPKRILFLLDPHRRYLNRQVDNKRKPLTKDKNVHTYLKLQRHFFKLMNEGLLADYHGSMEDKITPEMESVDRQIHILKEKLRSQYGDWLPEP